MASQKTYFSIALFLLLLFFLPNCEKRPEKESTTVTISVKNPVEGKGYSGVPYEIMEYYDEQNGWGSSFKETEDSPIAVGKTDASGSSEITFHKKKSVSFHYALVIDMNKENIGYEDYRIFHKKEDGALAMSVNIDSIALSPNVHDYDFNFNVLGFATYYIHIKNIGCPNDGDKMMFRWKYIHNSSGFLESDSTWSSWSDLYEHCDGFLSNSRTRLQDYQINQMKIMNNGQTSYKIDTFYFNPDPEIDTMKLYF